MTRTNRLSLGSLLATLVLGGIVLAGVRLGGAAAGTPDKSAGRAAPPDGAKPPLETPRGSKPAATKAAKEGYRVRVFRGYEKDPAGEWQSIYLDQVVPLGRRFDVRDKNDTAAAEGVLQRTKSGQLHFKGRIRIGYNVGTIDVPVESGKPIKARGGLAGAYFGEDLGICKYAMFVCFERPNAERPGNVKVIQRTSAIQEKVGGGVFPKRAEVLVVPGPRPQKQALSQWFQSRLKADNVLTAGQETWLLFRSQHAISTYDRMSIERIERQGNTFIVTMNYTPYLGPLWRNALYHEVHGINLGKLSAGDYTVKWMIGSFNRDGRTEELKSPGGWQELKRSFNVRPGR